MIQNVREVHSKSSLFTKIVGVIAIILSLGIGYVLFGTETIHLHLLSEDGSKKVVIERHNDSTDSAESMLELEYDSNKPEKSKSHERSFSEMNSYELFDYFFDKFIKLIGALSPFFGFYFSYRRDKLRVQNS